MRITRPASPRAQARTGRKDRVLARVCCRIGLCLFALCFIELGLLRLGPFGWASSEPE
jgi:hypothetical protein